MQPLKKSTTNTKELVKKVISLIENGNAHVSLDDALKDIPFLLLGKTPRNLPYSIWQLAEHIRIAQWDILEFSRNPKHISPEWPGGYWPAEAAPQSEAAWQKCVDTIQADRKAFIKMVKNAGDALDKAFEYGDGQSLLREAFVLADHNSYHTGELVIIRRVLNIWNK